MDMLEVLATAQALLKIGGVLAQHIPTACAKLTHAAARMEAADTPSDKVRAVFNGLQDAADEARGVLNDLAPQTPPKAS